MKNFLDFIKKHKFIFIIVFVLILLITGYYIFQYFEKKNSFHFYDEKSNLSLQLPKTWEELEKKQIFKYSVKGDLGFQKIKSDKTALIMTIEEAKGKNNFQIQESIKVLDDSLPDKAKGYQKKESQEIEIVDTKGLQYDFNYVSSGLNILTGQTADEEDMRQRKIIFLKDEKMYYIDFSAKRKLFDEDVKDFEKIIKTLKIEDSKNK